MTNKLPTPDQIIRQLCDADKRHPMAEHLTIETAERLAKLTNNPKALD